jgi:hypothetical protein
MEVIVLKVRHQENLDELAQVIKRGRTLDGPESGWRMPVTAQPGDLAVWYAGSPDQQYVAYGWITGLPAKREPTRQPYGPVAGVRCLPSGPVPRSAVAHQTHGFQETNVSQLAVTVPAEVADAFLRALGFDQRWIEVRERISLEVTHVAALPPAREVWQTAQWLGGVERSAPSRHPEQAAKDRKIN